MYRYSFCTAFDILFVVKLKTNCKVRVTVLLNISTMTVISIGLSYLNEVPPSSPPLTAFYEIQCSSVRWPQLCPE
jgi:hypothetical protein